MALFPHTALPEVPFQLRKANLPHTCGYSPEDNNFVLGRFAASIGAGYINLLNVLHKNDEEALLGAIGDAFSSDTVIMSDAFVWTKDPANFEMMDTLAEWFATVYQSNDPASVPKKILFPVTVISQDKEVHALVGAIDFNPATRKLDFTLLDQHVNRNNPKLDFSKEIDVVGQRFAEKLGGSFHTNAEPYCSVRNVCGIASIETIKTLAMTKDRPSFSIAADGSALALDEDAVRAAHGANLELAGREPGALGGEMKR
ncbi:MAG: hypothetical protein WDN72_11280 [Alphaproteobacteria bacterium]